MIKEAENQEEFSSDERLKTETEDSTEDDEPLEPWLIVFLDAFVFCLVIVMRSVVLFHQNLSEMYVAYKSRVRMDRANRHQLRRQRSGTPRRQDDVESDGWEVDAPASSAEFSTGSSESAG